MKTHTRYVSGFTLIELLVVIAIIGVLSAVVLTSLGQSRTKARIAAVQEQLHGMQTAGNQCLNDSATIVLPTEANDGGQGLLCAGNIAAYKVLPAGWIWCDGNAGVQSPTDCGNDVSASAGITFTLTAESDVDGSRVSCTETTCTTATDPD